ncbi:MAG: fumarylacetoacetate hydrolase family protein [Bacteroidota bacterium]|nr:fumarylacetoacetate hydrolase family protein [Bacteroidota bacterium]MDP4233211.1 fumarylacetoacetate hydrolase family protein [Bacteroidota bacterium]MDP4242170.1 fumarylacetoacetate hydrolase family protein [Bacteroidota bacterium]MDP4287820.1 fumarylacetoacetate hydrolase family protein [Bacteroidota bacterium]
MRLIFDRPSEEEYEAGTVFCVGRNFVEHAEELGNEVPQDPIIFTKPYNAIRHGSYNIIEYPPRTKELHFEGELILLLRGGGRNIQAYSAADVIAGYGVGLDLTMRDFQNEAKRKGLPWTVAKGFDGAAQISHFIPFESAPPFEELGFSLWVNDELRQRASTNQMIFSPEMLMPYISRFFAVRPGDLLFTGTPRGTGPLAIEDKIIMQLHTANPDEVLLDFHAQVTEWG